MPEAENRAVTFIYLVHQSIFMTNSSKSKPCPPVPAFSLSGYIREFEKHHTSSSDIFTHFARHEKIEGPNERKPVEKEFTVIVREYFLAKLVEAHPIDKLIIEAFEHPDDHSVLAVEKQLSELGTTAGGRESLLRLREQIRGSFEMLASELRGLQKFGIGTYLIDYPFTAALFRHDLNNAVEVPMVKLTQLDRAAERILERGAQGCIQSTS